MNDNTDLELIPDSKDWQVVQHDKRVFVQSNTVAHEMRNYDDSCLEIAGNMLVDEKLKLAQFVINKLNSESAADQELKVSELKADNSLLRGLILKALDRWWPFVHGAIGASYTAKNLFKELSDGIQSVAPREPQPTPVAEVIGVTESFGEGDEERFCEGTSVRMLQKLPKGTKLYLLNSDPKDGKAQ